MIRPRVGAAVETQASFQFSRTAAGNSRRTRVVWGQPALDCPVERSSAVVDSNVFPEANAMAIQQVGVIGAGTMGNGIAHVFARTGFSVVLCDVERRFLDRALETITRNLDREVTKNKITLDDKATALKRIQPVTDRAKLADCDFVIEAATEKFEVKA